MATLKIYIGSSVGYYVFTMREDAYGDCLEAVRDGIPA